MFAYIERVHRYFATGTFFAQTLHYGLPPDPVKRTQSFVTVSSMNLCKPLEVIVTTVAWVTAFMLSAIECFLASRRQADDLCRTRR